ncbi:unnamed protein product, partial [Heterobilharzia americana]
MDTNSMEKCDWVQLVDPKTQQLMYIHLKSGECSRDPPKNAKVKTVSPNQWWELFDVKAQRNYYYNSCTRETVWQKPIDGDIIPLAKIQLLQQNHRPSFLPHKDDIGVLRHSNNINNRNNGNMNPDRKDERLSTSLTQRNCSTSSVLDIPSYSINNMLLLQQNTNDNNNNNQLNYYPISYSTTSNVNHDYVDKFNENMNGIQSPILLSSSSSSRIIMNDTVNQSTSNRIITDSQRVHDWLRDSTATMNNEKKSTISYHKHGVNEAITTDNNSVNNNNNNSGIKKPGCLSDRPIRRHNIHSTSQLQGLVEFPSPVEDNFIHSPIKSSVAQSINPNNNNNNNDNNNNNIFPAYSNTPLISSPCFTSESTSNMSKEHIISSFNEFTEQNIIHDKSLLLNNHNNDMCEIVKQSSMPPINSQSMPYPVTRQRAFPRTNPTVSRPLGNVTCTLPRTCIIPSENSSILLTSPSSSSSNALNQFNETKCTRISMIDSKLPVIHRSNSKDSSALIKSNFTGDYASGNSNQNCLPDYIITSCSSVVLNAPIKVSCTISEFTPSSYSLNESTTKMNLRNYLPIDSPLSASPHPSSSPVSPTSFSSGSSATALTTANSEESVDISNIIALNHENCNDLISSDSKQMLQQSKPHASVTSCLTNATCEYSHYFPVLNEDNEEKLEEEEEQMRPPTPPPRSASTLCSQGIPNLFFVSFPNHLSFNTPISQFDQSTGYLQTHYLISSQPYTNPSRGSNTNVSLTSSLSRNHPSRAHVIQPNHRRPHRSQYFTQQIQTGSQFLSDDKDMKCNENSVVIVDDTCMISQADLFNSQQPRILNPWIRNTTDITTLPNSGICITTIGVDVSHASHNSVSNVLATNAITVWDSYNCINNSLQIVDSGINKTPMMMTTAISTSGKTYSSTNRINNLPRSASGGFIGPAESMDSSSIWTYGSYNNTQYKREHVLSLRRFMQPIYVHPGHPAFSSFIEPFNWPSYLFKPDADIRTLMSWTKSNFSKRLLVSSEPGLKKQVAQLFKVIQSFMGDRKARLSLPDYGSIIIHRALSSANLRDELYAQLCKQTTSNPDMKSLTNGWALLCVCLYYFPPNSKFRDHLYAYLQSRSDASVIINNTTTSTTTTTTTTVNSNLMSGIDDYNNSAAPFESSLKTAAAIASGLHPFQINNNHNNNNFVDKSQQSNDASINLKLFTSYPTTNNHNYPMGIALGPWDRPTAAHFARVAPRWFVRSLNVGVRKTPVSPSIEEICHVKDFLLKPCIFGSSLNEMMQLQAYRFPHLRLPWIQIFLTEEILHLNGAQTEGIFRLSPDMDVLIEVRCQLEKLFEIFRVVQLCDPDHQTDNHTSEYDLCNRFLVHRPPPPGWSTSVRVIEAEENQNSTEADSKKFKQNSLLSSSIDWDCLTGEFSWPLLPDPLSLPPAEYVLLTPTAYWPRNLSSIIKRSCTLSTSSTASSSIGNTNGHNSTNMESHLAAGLLKLWLRELSEPLIPVELQPICLKAACEAEAYESQEKDSVIGTTVSNDLDPIQKCCRLVRRLNPLPRRSLLYLILLLQHLSKSEYSN